MEMDLWEFIFEILSYLNNFANHDDKECLKTIKRYEIKIHFCIAVLLPCRMAYEGSDSGRSV